MIHAYIIGVILATVLVVLENYKSFGRPFVSVIDILFIGFSWFTVGLWVYVKCSNR